MLFDIICCSVILAINVMILGFLLHSKINKYCHYNLSGLRYHEKTQGA